MREGYARLLCTTDIRPDRRAPVDDGPLSLLQIGMLPIHLLVLVVHFGLYTPHRA